MVSVFPPAGRFLASHVDQDSLGIQILRFLRLLLEEKRTAGPRISSSDLR